MFALRLGRPMTVTRPHKTSARSAAAGPRHYARPCAGPFGGTSLRMR